MSKTAERSECFNSYNQVERVVSILSSIWGFIVRQIYGKSRSFKVLIYLYCLINNGKRNSIEI
jgi:hypothetical protein